MTPYMAGLDYSASTFIVKNGNLALEDSRQDMIQRHGEAATNNRLHIMGGGRSRNIDNDNIMNNNDGKMSCSKPARVEGTLIYKGGSKQPLTASTLPHSTEVRLGDLLAG